MNGLFVYDGPISKIKNEYYGVALNNEMFQRYRNLVNELKIAVLVKEREEIADKLSAIDLPFITGIIELPNRNLKNINKAKQTLEDSIKNADIIIIRLPSLYGNYAANIARRLKKPYIVELVASPWGTLWGHSLKGKFIAPYMWYITRENVKKAKYLMYVTKRYLQKYYPNKFNSISLSDVQLKENDEEILKNRMKKNKSIQSKTILIGTIGGLGVKFKGQQDVIKAVAKLKKQGYNIQYEMVGDGKIEKLQKIAEKNGVKENIKFIGPMQHKEVFNWLDKINIYIQPSHQEGFSRALIEALSRACPCIASNAGGNPEIVSKDYIFKRKNVNQIVEKIKDILQHMDEQSKINYDKSKEYQIQQIEAERQRYYQEFINDNIESEN